MRRLRGQLILLATLGASGCIGVIGTGDDIDGEDPTSTDPQALGVDDTRRLSPATYAQSLRSLLGEAAVADAEAALQLLPNDRADNEFTTMERGITAGHVDAYFSVAKAVADAVSVDAGRRAELAPCLGDATPTDACVESSLTALGRRAFRRPLTDDERGELMAVFTEGRDALTFADGFALSLMTLLQSPAFLYQLELGEGDDAVPQVKLTGYELASRLALFLTGAPPDDTLLDRAAAGELDDPDAYAAEVERLLGTDAARQMVRRFVSEWLHLEQVPVPEQNATFLDGLDPAATQAEMRDELQTLAEHHVFDAGSDYKAFLSSDLTFGGENLAAIYGQAADGEVPVATADRAGLLTRAGILANPRESTQPILRAAWVLRNLLCDDIELPPPSSEIVVEEPQFDPNKTARERWTDATSGGVCGACHQRINPFGFALEGYDALGRPRQLEPILDPGDGSQLNELPIDAEVTLSLDGEDVSVNGATELSRALADSPRAQACFAQKWFRFSFGRHETPHEVKAMVEAVQQRGTSLRDVLAALAQSPNFRVRTLPTEN